ncbi:hypothetical protein AAG906_011787 [Vitis piasezkii]
MGFFKEFHERGRFVRSLNTTILVLVPKKRGADDLRDFRPISLVGGLYKLLAKVLANRLKKVVGKVVSSSQNAFVEGRQILDTALIANEAIDSMLKMNESGVLSISGLRINLDRSEILPVGKVENVELLALELSCKMGALPSTYLGLLLGAPHKAMPIYLMSLMHMQELALLCKWSWRFAVERESLWRLVISRKFGVQERGWRTHENPGSLDLSMIGSLVSMEHHLEPLCSPHGGFLCLGSIVGEGFDLGSTQKEGGLVGELVFALFGMMWVLLLVARDTLLGKKQDSFWK